MCFFVFSCGFFKKWTSIRTPHVIDPRTLLDQNSSQSQQLLETWETALGEMESTLAAEFQSRRPTHKTVVKCTTRNIDHLQETCARNTAGLPTASQTKSCQGFGSQSYILFFSKVKHSQRSCIPNIYISYIREASGASKGPPPTAGHRSHVVSPRSRSRWRRRLFGAAALGAEGFGFVPGLRVGVLRGGWNLFGVLIGLDLFIENKREVNVISKDSFFFFFDRCVFG